MIRDRLRALVISAVASLGSGGAPDSELPAVEPAQFAAVITDPAVDEISGVAASRRHPGILWAHNDSGDAPRLYALGPDGRVHARIDVTGARHVDWEDIAAFELDGAPMLLVADIGDNGGVRGELQLYVLREPERIADIALRPEWTIRFRWPDGARDAEAVAVDVAAGEILLASKRRVPAEVFRLPLRPADDGVQTAERIGLLSHIEQPSAAEREASPVFGRYRSQVTGMDLSPDGLTLAILTYQRIYLHHRGEDEAWAPALDRTPRVLRFPWLAQAEAIAWDLDGRGLWLTSERLPAPLLWVDAAGSEGTTQR
jgi:hypothetical protein